MRNHDQTLRRPTQWSTRELEYQELAGVLTDVHGTVLLDSLTTSVATAPHFSVEAEAVCTALRKRDGDTIVVSDEVGLGVHPSTEVGNRFRDALGLLNQQVAAVADDVLLVVAGRTLRLT